MLVAVLALAGCSGSTTPAAALQPTRPETAVTPSPTPAATPTYTPTAPPTATPSETPTLQPTPTATPMPTATPPALAGKPAASDELVFVGIPNAADGRPQVNISFDVEGDPELLYQILDTLERFGYRTTFFLQGDWVALHPEAAQRIAEAGHELGNHSWSHQNFKPMSREEVSQELNDTENLVLELTGQSTKPFFRPPFGSRSDLSVQTAYELGYTTIIWTYGAEDWVAGATAETIYENVFGNAAPGALYYMHTSRQINVDALPRILQSFQDAGFALASLSAILAES